MHTERLEWIGRHRPAGQYLSVQMKCLLIASESAEVLFHWTDPEFQQNVQKQYGASQEDGQGVKRKEVNRHSVRLLTALNNSRPFSFFFFAFCCCDGQLPAFEDSISTLFAPIIISCITMVDRLRDSYTSFTTENHHIYVLHQVTADPILSTTSPWKKSKWWQFASCVRVPSCTKQISFTLVLSHRHCGLNECRPLVRWGNMYVMWVLLRNQAGLCPPAAHGLFSSGPFSSSSLWGLSHPNVYSLHSFSQMDIFSWAHDVGQRHPDLFELYFPHNGQHAEAFSVHRSAGKLLDWLKLQPRGTSISYTLLFGPINLICTPRCVSDIITAHRVGTQL